MSKHTDRNKMIPTYKPKANKLRKNLTNLELQMRKVAEELRSLRQPYGKVFEEKANELEGAAGTISEWNENILEEMR